MSPEPVDPRPRRGSVLRKALLWAGANVLFLEALCFASFVSGLALSRPIYRDGWFDCASCNLEAYDRALGWDSYRPEGIRPSPALAGKPRCGAVFGDSFTHADEVHDDEAWPNLLSNSLGCGIANMGVPGYGQDQAVLKYEARRPTGRFATLGLSAEMLRRNFAASWRFYAEQARTLPKPYFVLRDHALHLTPPPRDLDRSSIRAHHLGDRYYDAFRVQFPYSLSLLRVLSYRAAFSDRFATATALQGRRDALIHPSFAAWSLPASVDLAKRLVERFVSAVRADGKAPVIILLPSLEYLGESRPPYENYAASSTAEHPGVCFVDAFQALRQQQRDYGSLRAPRGHPNADGNRVIAETVAAAFQNECRLP